MYERNPPPRLRNTNSLFNFPEIPDEILFDEILARLPVKSLSRFKCVSKPWRTLIESDRFIKIHYRNSAKNPRVVMLSCFGERMSVYSLQWLLNELKEGSDRTRKEPNEGVLVGSCNGVVCLYKLQGHRSFSLWNPATRASAELPDNDNGVYIVKYGFGCDESSGAYKVFIVLYDYRHGRERGILYSSDTNSWRHTPPGSASPAAGERGIFLRGNLHWIDGCNFQIECFDLGREEFGMIDLPLNSSNYSTVYGSWLRLGVIGGNLSMLFLSEKGFEVWVMKEYGVKDSWLKFLTFRYTLSRPMNYATRPLFRESPNGETFIILRNIDNLQSQR